MMAEQKYVGMMFSPESIQQIVAGNKTQTRRPVNWRHKKEGDDVSGFYLVAPDGDGCKVANLPCYPGDIIYVKEPWCKKQIAGYDIFTYQMQFAVMDSLRTHYPTASRDVRHLPAYSMPKALAQHFLEVIEARVERLQDISPADAIAEGIKGPILLIGDEPSQTEESYWHYIDKRPCGKKKFNELHDFWFDVALSPVESYATMWDYVNRGKNRPKWADNPLVFAISFRYLENHKNPFQ